MTKQDVHKRLVYYISGFDPMPSLRYREGYRSEGAKQAKISGYQLQVERLSTLSGFTRFEVESKFEDANIRSEFRFLQWNDLVERRMNVPIWRSWLDLFSVGRVIALSGALFRLIRLHFPPNIAGLYPFVMIPFQILTSLWIAFWVGGMLSSPIGSPVFAQLAIALPIFIGLVICWRRMDGHLLAYYMLHDLAYICEANGYTPPSLRKRLDEFKDEIAQQAQEDWDEILIVGHSSGAHLGVILLAELRREDRVKASDRVALITLGQAIPLVSYLPGACDLRLALSELGQGEDVDWVDVSAPMDGASFALHDPVACSVELDAPQTAPLVISAAFKQTLSAETLKRLRMRFFRLHFQYICHFDKPNIYDYFAITSGPLRLGTRFEHTNPSPSRQVEFLNKFKDRSP